MTWFRVDDHMHSHPKFAGLSDAALASWTRSGSWSADLRTGGYLPTSVLEGFRDGDAPAVGQELTRRGLWVRAVGGWQFHDWPDYNATSIEALVRDEQKEVTKKLHRRPELLRAVRDRDGSQCQRCMAEVSWSDKRSDAGGTYALVDRSLGFDLANVVVVCRGCTRPCGQGVDSPVGNAPDAAPTPPDRGTRSIRRGAKRGQVGTSPGTSPSSPPSDTTATGDPHRPSSTAHSAAAETQPGLRPDSTPNCPPGSLSRSTSSRDSFPGTGPETARERALHAADPPEPDPAELDERYAVHRPTGFEQERAR